MNINYAQIIETANKRKDALIQLEDVLKHTPDMLRQAEAVLHWMITLASAYAALDSEGRKLLPAQVNNQIYALPLSLAKGVVDGALINSGACGLRRLNAAIA